MTPQNQLTHQVLVHHPLARNPGLLCSSILPRVSRIQIVLQSRFYPSFPTAWSLTTWSHLGTGSWDTKGISWMRIGT